jgi:hypothetical protein
MNYQKLWPIIMLGKICDKNKNNEIWNNYESTKR